MKCTKVRHFGLEQFAVAFTQHTSVESREANLPSALVWWETCSKLQAAMSLSRLWQQQGKKDDARQMLAEIYGWFTEGFDTKDLQEAKALLEELT